MRLQQSSTWPLKVLIAAALYCGSFGNEAPYLPTHVTVLQALAVVLLVLQTTFFLPSVLFTVSSRERTSQALVQSCAYIAVMFGLFNVFHSAYPEASASSIPFAAAHLLYHQYDCAAHDSCIFNTPKTTALIAALACLLTGCCTAYACRSWPPQLVLLPCVLAGELVGLATSVVTFMLATAGNVYEVSLAAM